MIHTLPLLYRRKDRYLNHRNSDRSTFHTLPALFFSEDSNGNGIIVFHTIIINKLGNSFDFHQNYFSVYSEDVEQSTRHLERFTCFNKIPTFIQEKNRFATGQVKE